MADRERRAPPGRLRVPKIWYRRRLTVLLLLSTGLAVSLWHVHSTRQLWEDSFVGLVDLRAVLFLAWFWFRVSLGVVAKWILNAFGRFGACRITFLLVFFALAATALSAFFLGSLNDYAWKCFVDYNFVHKLEQNILRISDRTELSVHVEPHPLTKGKSSPFLLETFHRYNGEDVKFTCESLIEVSEDAILHSGMIMWTRNNESVGLSSRHNVNTTLTKLDGTRKNDDNITLVRYSFYSELRIYLIENSDYGEYMCLVYREYYLDVHSDAGNTSSRNTHNNFSREELLECPRCKLEAVHPLGELLAALKCADRNLKKMTAFLDELTTELNKTSISYDKRTYERFVNEYEHLYFCSIKFLRLIKKMSLKIANGSFSDTCDEMIQTIKATGKRMLDALQSLRNTIWTVNDLVEKTLLTGEYHLIETPERLEQMMAAPGAMFSFSGVFHYLADTDPVIVTYEINGRSVDFCQESVGPCSKVVFLYWLFFRDGGSYWNLLKYYFHYFPSGCQWLVNSRRQTYASLYMEFWKCLCYSSFGTHRFIFHRLFYNASSGRTVVHDIPHPHSVYIAPKPSELFHGYRNTSGNPRLSPIESCWGTQSLGPPDSPCDQQEPWIKDSISSFWWWEMEALTAGTVIWTLVILFGLVFLPILLGRHGRRLFLEDEVFSRPRVLPPGSPSLGSMASTPGQEKIYDVYISHAQEDSDFVQNSLARFLEDSGLKVFLRNRDVPLGTSFNVESVRALNKSRKFLVVASPEYLADRWCNDHEFQYILGNVNDHLIDQQDVLLYLNGMCHVPHVLHGYPRLDATDRAFSDLDLQACLLAWAQQKPVTFTPQGWRSWMPSTPVLTCSGACLLAAILVNEHNSSPDEMTILPR